MHDLYLIYAVFLGLTLGSFLNVVVYRLPIILFTKNEDNLSLLWPPSHCTSCCNHLKWWQNIPVMSYIILAGRCRYCFSPISVVYPLMEISLGCLFYWMVLIGNGPLDWVAGCVYAAFGLGLGAIDMRNRLLPDVMTVPFFLCGIVFNYFGFWTDFYDSFYSGIFGYVFLYGINAIFLWLRGRDGIGGGDFKLVAGLGAWFGFESLLIVILLACFTGLLFAGLLYVIRSVTGVRLSWSGIEGDDYIPFGPFLLLGGLIVFVQDWHYLLIPIKLNIP
jgi:leader peptidase (prepilin peptidase)/N-methyltransferase